MYMRGVMPNMVLHLQIQSDKESEWWIGWESERRMRGIMGRKSDKRKKSFSL